MFAESKPSRILLRNATHQTLRETASRHLRQTIPRIGIARRWLESAFWQRHLWESSHFHVADKTKQQIVIEFVELYVHVCFLFQLNTTVFAYL